MARGGVRWKYTASELYWGMKVSEEGKGTITVSFL